MTVRTTHHPEPARRLFCLALGMSPRADLIIRLIAALMLGAAAVLKGVQLATDVAGPESLERITWIGLVVFEWSLAWLLVSGVWPKAVGRVTIATFAVFAATTLYLLWLGAESCGCFGALPVAPWITLCVDLLILGLLLVGGVVDSPSITSPNTKKEAAVMKSNLIQPSAPSPKMIRRFALVFALAIGLPGLWVMASFEPGVKPNASSEIAPTPGISTTAAFEGTSGDDSISGGGGASGDGGELIIVKQTDHDFGYIEPGSTHRLRFLLTNDSDQPWTIQRAKAECKCMKITQLPQRINPGETSAVEITFDAFEKPQHYNKKVAVYTDRSDQPKIDLTLAARIGLPLRIDPQVLDFGVVSAGESKQLTVIIFNEGPESVKLLYSAASSKAVAAYVPRQPIEPGGQVELPITVTPAGDQTGDQQSAVAIRTNAPAQRQVSINIRFTSSD